MRKILLWIKLSWKWNSFKLSVLAGIMLSTILENPQIVGQMMALLPIDPRWASVAAGVIVAVLPRLVQAKDIKRLMQDD